MSYVETLKICGQTVKEDIESSLEIGADYIGLITYSKSPRGVSIERAGELARSIPAGRAVLVDVDPEPEHLRRGLAQGFSKFQIHSSLENRSRLDEYLEVLTPGALWLAPRLKPGEVFPDWLFELSDHFLIDTYSPTQVGGTGRTGDWTQFNSLQKKFPEKRWILAGGLTPDNVGEAIEATGARHLDVNSGVESAPGRKDYKRLLELGRRIGRVS